MRTIKSDELNYLIWRYLKEGGFKHSAFIFGNESGVAKSDVRKTQLPIGSLIQCIQRGIQYMEIEKKTSENNYKFTFKSPFELLNPEIQKERIKFQKEREKVAKAKAERAEIIGPGQYSDMHKDNVEYPYTNKFLSGMGLFNDPKIITLKRTEKERKQIKKYGHGKNVRKSSVTFLRGHTMEVFIVAWNPHDSSQVISGSGDKTARIFDIPSGPSGPNRTIECNESVTVMSHKAKEESVLQDVTSFDWSKCGRYLATGSYDGVVRIWNQKGKLQQTLYGHEGPIFSLKFNRSGTHAISGSVDKTVIIWDIVNSKVLQRLQSHSAPTLDVDWKDDKTFASCSTDKTISLNKIGMNIPLRILTGHTNEINAIRWSPDGEFLASCSDDHTCKIWTLDHDKYVYDFCAHKKEIYTVRWNPQYRKNPNGVHIATASFDSTIKVWDVLKGKCQYTLMKHTDPVYSVAFSPNGKYLASGSFDSRLNMYHVHNGELITTFMGSGSIFEVCWNHTGDKIAACFSNSNLKHFFCTVMDFNSNI